MDYLPSSLPQRNTRSSKILKRARTLVSFITPRSKVLAYRTTKKSARAVYMNHRRDEAEEDFYLRGNLRKYAHALEIIRRDEEAEQAEAEGSAESMDRTKKLPLGADQERMKKAVEEYRNRSGFWPLGFGGFSVGGEMFLSMVDLEKPL